MMSMLRSDGELALDEVVESCREAADHYRTAAELAHGELADFFQVLHRRRQDSAAFLEEEIRRTGTLPSAPDADREALEHLATRVRAAFSRDERQVLMRDSERLEARLADRLETALAFSQPPAIADTLQRLQVSVGEVRRHLRAAGGD